MNSMKRQNDRRSSIESAKTRPRPDCGSDHELLIAKFRLKLKKVGIPLDHSKIRSKIFADGDCSLEIKRVLLFERKVMTNLDSILKSRDITLPTRSI